MKDENIDYKMSYNKLIYFLIGISVGIIIVYIRIMVHELIGF